MKPQQASCSFDALLRLLWVEVEESGWPQQILRVSHRRELRYWAVFGQAAFDAQNEIPASN